MTVVNGREFVTFIVKAMPGKHHIRVGQRDSFKVAVTIFRRRGALDVFATEKPIAVEGKNAALRSLRSGSEGGQTGTSGQEECTTIDHDMSLP